MYLYCIQSHTLRLLSTSHLLTVLNAMEFIKDASKNINLYDVKAYVRKVQNGMFFVAMCPELPFRCPVL